MSRRSTGNSLGSLRPEDRVEIFRKEWLAADVESVVDGRVSIIFFEQGSTKRKSLHVHDDSLRIPPAIIPPHAAVSLHVRPSFLAIDVTDEMKQVQRSSPTMWAMTLAQWNQFIDFCKSTPVWQDIKNQKGQNGHVNLYDMNKHFVIPWTCGTGCSVAVLMNKDTRLEANVMLSHSWAEDMEECQEAVNNHFDDEHIARDTAVWFCGFGLYQPEDRNGPTIQQQIKLNPFAQVISSDPVKSSRGRMIAVHTTQADLWKRMWCVREVREAMTQGVKVKAAFSKEYVNHFKSEYSMMINNGCAHQDGLDAAGITVRTALADCRKEDKPMLLQELSKHGTLSAVDKVTTDLRASLVKHLAVGAALDAAKCGKPQALIDLTKLGDLEAVDGLHEVAETGDEQACDALCDALGCILDSHTEDLSHAMYVLCWKNRLPALELPIVLLQTMANRQHNKSFDLLLQFDWKPWKKMVGEPASIGGQNAVNVCICHPTHGHAEKLQDKIDRQSEFREEYRDTVDTEAWRNHHAKLLLQAMAQQGNQRAVDELVSLAEQQDDAKFALQSLAEQWNRQVLKALQNMRNEAWADNVLKKSENSLTTLNQSGM